MLAQGTTMDGPEGKQIQSVEEMIGRFTAELLGHIDGWKEGLIEAPGDLEEIERKVHRVFARGADMMIAGLMGITMSGAHMDRVGERTRKEFSRALEKGRVRMIAVRLLGGMILWVASLYCPPKKKRFRKDEQPRVGLDVTLAQFGFGKGVSPALQSRVARQVALCPSIDFAHQELQREGVELDAKAVKRITYQCGEGLLALRKHRIELLRAGKLSVGDELAGKRISVQIDGGRMKIRGSLKTKGKTDQAVDDDGLLIGDAPGRSRKKPKRTYKSDWREPKLITIFEHDEQGRMLKRTKATIGWNAPWPRCHCRSGVDASASSGCCEGQQRDVRG